MSTKSKQIIRFEDRNVIDKACTNCNFWCNKLFPFVVWFSFIAFGVYIAIFFGGAVVTNQYDAWNEALPTLYSRGNFIATFGILLHFIAGSVLLILGPIQLMSRFRSSNLQRHRIIGRVYASAAFLAGLGGILKIMTKPTIGGTVMDIAFFIYGFCMMAASITTVHYARNHQVTLHKEWALRLFSLSISSWLYRLYYALWFVTVGSVGHTSTFDGWFDYFLDFWFFIGGLLFVELYYIHPARQAALAKAEEEEEEEEEESGSKMTKTGAKAEAEAEAEAEAKPPADMKKGKNCKSWEELRFEKSTWQPHGVPFIGSTSFLQGSLTCCASTIILGLTAIFISWFYLPLILYMLSGDLVDTDRDGDGQASIAMMTEFGEFIQELTALTEA